MSKFNGISEANTPAIASAATALADNKEGFGGGDNRKGWSIQNLGQNTLYVRLGAGASTTLFHVALKAGTANDDGTGGYFEEKEGSVYQGIVTIAGNDPRYTVTEYA